MLVVSQHVPPALRGIVIAGFMAAFMSTIATQLNWGASYLVSDFYRRFIKRDADDKHYVLISRLATVLLVIASAWFRFCCRIFVQDGRWCWKLAQAPAASICCAGTGGGSMPGARFRRWRRRWW